MVKIGLISDTHGYLTSKELEYFKDCDEIWHAGDFGSIEVSDMLSNFKPLRGVYGNIDGQEIRSIHPLHQRFKCEEVDVYMIHIGGYPGRYSRDIRDYILQNPPKLFISGHSHILKIVPDKKLDLIHMNPGAAGKHGFHKVRTLIRFDINGKKLENVQVIELGKRV